MAFVFRPTLALGRKMGALLRGREFALAGRSVLGDWYANEISWNKPHLIALSSERARLPLVMEAAPYKTLHLRLPAALAELLRTIGIPEDAIARELLEMRESAFATSNNRSVSGTLLVYRKELEWALSAGRAGSTMLEHSLYLTQGFCTQIDERLPIEAAVKRFAARG